MADVLVLGGGLAGLASAAALGQSGHRVTVLEARAFLGGRATSYPLPADESGEIIDNCQHILLRCCVNLLDFYHLDPAKVTAVPHGVEPEFFSLASQRQPEPYLLWFEREGFPHGKLGEHMAQALEITRNGLLPLLAPLLDADR